MSFYVKFSVLDSFAALFNIYIYIYFFFLWDFSDLVFSDIFFKGKEKVKMKVFQLLVAEQ